MIWTGPSSAAMCGGCLLGLLLAGWTVPVAAQGPCDQLNVQVPYAPSPERQIQSRIDCIEQILQGLAASSAQPGQAVAVEELISEHPLIFPQSADEDSSQPRNIDEAVIYLEDLLVEEARKLGADESLPKVAEVVARESGDEPIDVVVPRRPQVASAPAVPESATPDQTEADAPAVKTLLDDETTTSLHDDTTLLRDVAKRSADDPDAILFDAINFWIGGAIQYDYYGYDGIFNRSDGGDRERDGEFRRMEGTVRAGLFDWGELKAQYDFNLGNFRDLYLRWVSPAIRTPVTVTVGNQKEPIGLDNLIGNKFSIAQERAAPVHAFGAWRSLGVRLHRAFELGYDERKLKFWEGDTAAITTSIGVFTEDIESTNDTDLAVTARVTAGRNREAEGQHIGVALSYREGDFYRVSFRPEIQHAERITLSRPDANTAHIAAVEAAYNNGPVHMRAEFFGADYSGRVDGYGAGGYFQAGWYVTGESRRYQPQWGILSPHSPHNRLSVEVFGRLSHTRGDDDLNGWNDYSALTLGGNLFYRKLRGSMNLIYGQSREAIDGEDSGLAVNARVQFLF